MRFCGHTETTAGCTVCAWCESPTPKGAAYRAAWGEPEPTSARGPCRHLGTETRRLGCPDCPGKVELKVFTCTKHGECTQGKRAEGVAGCCADGCYEAWPAPTYIPIDAGRLIPGHNFNCSVIVHQDRRLLAYRHNWVNARIHLAELGADWQPTRCLPPAWIDPPGYRGHEDPRLFTYRGRLHCSYTAYDGNRTDVGYQRFRDDLTAEAGWVLDIPERRPWEKNFMFFEWADGLYAIYTVTPHVVVKIDAGQAVRLSQTDWSPVWRWGEMRGGAPPVLVGDEFFHWFHARQEGSPPIYSLGVYAFEARPPFRVTRYVPRPLVLPRPVDRPTGDGPVVVYPGGALVDGNVWRVACGWMDCGARVYSFSMSQIEKEMRLWRI